MFLGRSEEGLAEVETAFRLSPRDPEAVFGWEYYMCVLHNRLAHWDQAIPWCEKSIVAAPQDYYYPYVELVAANAWAGHDKETRDAAAQLRKVNPYFTVQTWAGMHWSDDPTFNAQNQRILEGLRKAGVPEGQAKSD